MKIIYIKEVEKTHNLVARIILLIKRFLNIIDKKKINKNTIYYLPIFVDSKVSKYKIKKLSKKINSLLEQDASNTIVLSEYLNKNESLKNYLYIENTNILNGRYLFRCLIYKVLEYIFKIKNKAIEFRRSFLTN